jgi:RHS repeat-associated protein
MGGTNTDIASAPATTVKVWYRFRGDIACSTITVYQDGVPKLYSSNGGGTWSSGRVAFLQIGYGSVWFDNVVATTNVNPATVVSYDDYDAWGMVLEGRSGNSADGRQRYRWIGEELEPQTGYMLLGPRFYDPRMGRFGAVDPHEESYPDQSGYGYAFGNSLSFSDASGTDPADSTHGKGSEAESIPMPEQVVTGNRDPNYIGGIMTPGLWVQEANPFSLYTGRELDYSGGTWIWYRANDGLSYAGAPRGVPSPQLLKWLARVPARKCVYLGRRLGKIIYVCLTTFILSY